MTNQDLIQKAEAIAKSHAELAERCDAVIAQIDAIEARQAESVKRQLAIIEAMYAAIEAIHKPKETQP